MKIIYRFNDGTTSEVEVDEELGLSIEAQEREYQSYERKMRRWAPIRLMNLFMKVSGLKITIHHQKI